ncbi:hypothetical protein M0802_004569 [Mischocyttarus mexicanus]|nr:hypothetical protein M0802_004569 [Mischocyttarus mexicanus]
MGPSNEVGHWQKRPNDASCEPEDIPDRKGYTGSKYMINDTLLFYKLMLLQGDLGVLAYLNVNWKASDLATFKMHAIFNYEFSAFCDAVVVDVLDPLPESIQQIRIYQKSDATGEQKMVRVRRSSKNREKQGSVCDEKNGVG